MVTKGLIVRLEAQTDRGEELAAFLVEALPLAVVVRTICAGRDHGPAGRIHPPDLGAPGRK